MAQHKQQGMYLRSSVKRGLNSPLMCDDKMCQFRRILGGECEDVDDVPPPP